MVFKTSKIQKRGRWRPTKNSKFKLKKNKKYTQNWGIFKTIIIVWLCWVLLVGLIWSWVIYNKYIKDLPPITTLSEIKQPEATIFYDKNGTPFYTYSITEKRTYAEYEEISKHIVNAVVSIEDKTFFTNYWVDFKAILRSVFNKVTWKTEDFVWTSTVSQQLIKNVFLTNEKSVERKIKEAYLSFMMNKEYDKEKIMEIYLNKLEFWSNAFWVDQATKTFFWKPASEANVLEASMIASLPKSPTLYSPYRHYWRLVWYSYSYSKSSPEDKTIIKTKEDYEWNIAYKDKLIEIIENLKYAEISWEDKEAVLCWIDKNFYKKPHLVEDTCITIGANGMLNFLNDLIIRGENISDLKDLQDIVYEYQAWRKDNVLWRMLEEWHITFEEYKQAIIASIWFKFNIVKETFKYPHFTMYVRDYLQETYPSELLEQWGLHVYTTLDPDLQAKAEEITKKQVELNKVKYWAENAALVSINNKNGAIIAMVWWVDYTNEKWWNINFMTANVKPWSTMKPLVYAKAMENYGFWSKTPIYDLETKFWPNYTPWNFDWKFLWKMNISTALNNSRNIPAIKMFYLAGWMKKFESFINDLWINIENPDYNLWATWALWNQQLKWLELAWAYSVFANLGYKKDISPILEIKDSNYNTIEKLRNSPWEQVIDPGLAYIMNEIMASTGDRPEYWNQYLSLEWRKTSAKTWTATKENRNKPKMENWDFPQYPSDLWTIWYTPDITTVAWAWNDEWVLLMKANWLEWAAPMWKEFMEEAHKNIKPSIWNRPSNVISTKSSSISWLLAPEGFPEEFIEESLFLRENVPWEYDQGMKKTKVDSLCNWIPWPNTPEYAIKDVYYVPLRVIDDSETEWKESLQKWISEWKANELFEQYPNVVTEVLNKECSRSKEMIEKSNITFTSDIKDKDLFTIWNNKVNIQIESWNPLSRIDFIINWEIISSISWENKKSWIIEANVSIPKKFYGAQTLTIRAFDNIHYSSDRSYTIWVTSKDTTSPLISLINPQDLTHNIYKDQFFNLRAYVTDRSNIRSINLYLNDKPIKLGLLTKDLKYAINEDKSLEVWVHRLKIEAVDQHFNTSSKEIQINILER